MGIAIEMRITMIVMTTISSTKVNPRRDLPRHGRPKAGAKLPFRIIGSIGRLLRCLAIHIEHALPAPREALRIVLIAAQSPLGLAGERVHRNPSQEAHLLAVGTGQLDAFHRSEERRVGKECRSRWSPYH